MRLFVVGKLGEVIKKILELEDVLRETPNALLVTELKAYNEILTMWPIHDSVVMHQAIQIFKLNIEKLKMAEKELRSSSTSHGEICKLSTYDYFKYLDAVREDLKVLNELGMHIGPSPFLEVVDAVEQPKDNDSASSG